MDSTRRLNRINSNQLGLMIDFMTLNPELVLGKLTPTFTKHDRQKKWEELSALLNSDGLGVKKESIKWRKTWSDWKCIVKRKASAIRRYESGIGGAPECQRLTFLEDRCAKLIGHASLEELEGDTDDSHTESWNDHKSAIRIKAAKLESYKQAGKEPNYNERLSDLEKKVLEMLRSQNQGNTDLNSAQENSDSNESSDTGTPNISQEINSVINTLESICAEDGVSSTVVQESIGSINHLTNSGTSTILLVPVSAIKSEVASPVCFGVSDNNSLQVGIPEVHANSIQVVNVQASNVEVPSVETSDVQVLNIPTSSASNVPTSQVPNIETVNQENCEKNSKHSFSSSEPPPKRVKIVHQAKQSGLIQLLLRQNELLENISSTMERIEKFLEARDSPERVQRKNNLLENISVNMEKIAGSLEVTSKSLKIMAEK